MDEILKRDENTVTVLGGVTDDSNELITMLRIDPITKRLLVSATGLPGGGTVTSITAGTGLSSIPNPITSVGTIFLADTAVTPGAYTNANITIDQQGRITSATNGSAGIGTVSIVSVVTANGVSGSVANATTTPAITLTLGAITPSSIASTSFIGNNTFSGSNSFVSLPTSSAVPVSGNDLINKTYADTFALGLSVRQSCDVATTANVTLSGEQTIDGVLTSVSRVLVKNQSTASQNGIYTSGAGAWTRTTDYDTSPEVQAGTFTAIIGGNTQSNTLWVQTTQNPTINVSSLVFSQLSSGGSGTVTSVSVVSANGLAGSVSNPNTTPAITLSCSANGILQSNGTSITAKSVSGSGNIVLVTGATLITPTLGVATATSINGLTITSSTGTFTLTNAKTLAVTNTLTLSGTDSTVMTFPATSQTIVGLTSTQTITNKTINSTINVIYVNNAITAVANAATVPITHRLNTVTNNSASALTLTLTTASAVNGQFMIVEILDFSAVAQTITWVNTENSDTTVPSTSNGSTTLPRTVGFIFNGLTSLWRCVANT